MPQRVLRQRETFAYRFADGPPSPPQAPAPPQAPELPQAPPGPAGPAGPPQAATPPGGLGAAIDVAKNASGKPYDWGGAGEPGRGHDCSGYMSNIYNSLTGKNERFTTDTDFKSLGFEPGFDPDSHFNIGTNGLSGENGHMAGSLGGVNVESNGPNGTQYGGNALGPNASMFTQQYHLPNDKIVG